MFHIHCPVCVCIASVYRRLVTHYWKCKSAKKKELLYHLSGIFCLCTTNPQKRVKNESLVGPQQPHIGGIESSLFLANWHLQ